MQYLFFLSFKSIFYTFLKHSINRYQWLELVGLVLLLIWCKNVFNEKEIS